MDEPKFVRMQQNTRGFVAGQLRETSGLPRAIGGVAGDGKSEVLEVDANLVGPAGVQLSLDERGVREVVR